MDGRPVTAAAVDGMLQAQRSQPDWSVGVEQSGHGALGWCGRTSTELAATDGVVVAIDGRIYNQAEFDPAASIAELVARLHRKCGFTGAIAQLNGDFAITLYDAAAETLWLARDRFGVKPLYYSTRDGQFAFASRPRALLTLPWVSREPNRRFVALFAASHYRTFDNASDQSAYRDILQVPAAHALCVKNGTITRAPYWSLEAQPDFAEPEADLAERYHDLLLDAVSLRYRAAARPAFTLSGGMDSSSVLACAARVSGEPQHAVSSVYEDRTYDESSEIESMLGDGIAQWHRVPVDQPDVAGLVHEMVALHDEPVATATWLSHYLLCRQMRDSGFESLFGGLGGDELNAGEYEYYFFFFADLHAAGRHALLKHETGKWIENHDHPIFRKSVDVMWDGLTRLVDLSQPGHCRPDWRRIRRYYPALEPGYWNLAEFQPVMDHPFPSYLKNRTFQDIYRETIPCCLRAEDRHASAAGLEHFDPFYDHRLAEFMFRVPGTLQIRDGISKHLLRQAMRGILPEETRTRIKKTGWNAPAHVWFAQSGRELLRDLVGSHGFRERGIYDLGYVDKLIDEHDEIVSSQAPVDNHMMFLWQLVNLELWLQSV